MIDIIRKTIHYWIEDRASLLAAGIAYNLVFALGPILFLFLYVIGLILPAESETYQELLFSSIQSVAGTETTQILATIIDNIRSVANQGLTATIIFTGLFITIFGFINQLRNATNIIWHDKSPHFRSLNGWDNIRITGVLLAIAALWAGYYALDSLIVYLNPNLGQLSIPNTVLIAVQIIINISTFAMALQAIITFKLKWEYLFFGATIIALFFQVGTQILEYYFNLIADSPIFGAAGSFALLLVWIFYSTQIFIFGMELIKAMHFHKTQTRPQFAKDQYTAKTH